MPGTKFRVAVVGGGIGGLTLAVALSKYEDIELNVYEAATSFGEVGAGLGLWPRVWNILRTLGLEDKLLAVTMARPKDQLVPTFNYRKADQSEGMDIFTLMSKGMAPFHRPQFQGVLLDSLPPSCHTHLSKRLEKYAESDDGSLELLFTDGSTSRCDILVGADGLKSSVRRSLLLEKAGSARRAGNVVAADSFEASIDPLWSGTTTYRAVIPAGKLVEKDSNHRVLQQQMQYLGKNAHLIVYPIMEGKMLNFAAFHPQHNLENTVFDGPWVSTADSSEFKALFEEWEPEVRTLIDCVDSSLKWAIHTVKPLSSFISGRVVLLGDAAHAMTPFQGAGAGQAIEDAYVLATILGHPSVNSKTVERALQVYDNTRRPFTNDIAQRSRLAGQYFSLHHDGLDLDTQETLAKNLQDLSQEITKNWEWCWNSDLDVEDSLRMLSALQ